MSQEELTLSPVPRGLPKRRWDMVVVDDAYPYMVKMGRSYADTPVYLGMCKSGGASISDDEGRHRDLVKYWQEAKVLLNWLNGHDDEHLREARNKYLDPTGLVGFLVREDRQLEDSDIDKRENVICLPGGWYLDIGIGHRSGFSRWDDNASTLYRRVVDMLNSKVPWKIKDLTSGFVPD